MIKQKTLNSIVSIEGRGLHTGKQCKIRLCPAKENEGIFFVRTDIDTLPQISAIADNVTETSRGTTLCENGVSVSTIEHLMAALFANGIDNVRIEINCDEVPILDGSSKYWVELIQKAGVTDLDAEKKYFEVRQPLHYLSADGKTEYWALPSKDFSVTATIDFDSDLIGTQIAEIKDINDFNNEISKCRTFVFLSEISFLIDNNLIKGGDLDNAIVFADKPLTEESTDKIAEFFNKNKDDVKVEHGVINTIKLQHVNEPARHKLLDFIGDISLVCPNIRGHFIIKRPGHTNNTNYHYLENEYVKKDMDINNYVPVYDPNKEPVFDIMEIRKRLPHRFPMLLIDKIIEVGEDYIVGLKNVTGNEDFFNGHFPEEPVMPGVLIVEAFGQTGGMLVLKDAKEDEKWNTYFMKFEEVKFRNKVVPGDTLLLKLQQTGPVRRGIIQMKGTAYVGNKVCVEATLMAMVSKQ